MVLGWSLEEREHQGALGRPSYFLIPVPIPSQPGSYLSWRAAGASLEINSSLLVLGTEVCIWYMQTNPKDSISQHMKRMLSFPL